VRAIVASFKTNNLPAKHDGQIARAAERLGLIAAAGDLATAMGIVPWQPRESLDAAAWALAQWIEGRGGTEPAEVRQAIEQVRLFNEQHGDSRFEDLDDPSTRPINNRARWRRGQGASREWMIPPEVWKSEICSGLNPGRLLGAEYCGGGMISSRPL
jgi:putative DNA primase/helicase